MSTEYDSFHKTTAISRDASGQYTGLLDPSWSSIDGPHGGIIAALGVRACESEISLSDSSAKRLRSITTQFTKRPQWGPITFNVEVVQTGSRVTFTRFSGLQEARTVVTGMATFMIPDLETPIDLSTTLPAVSPAPADNAPLITTDEYSHNSDGWIEPNETFPSYWRHYFNVALRKGDLPLQPTSQEKPRHPFVGGWVKPKTPTPIDNALIVQAADFFWPPAFEICNRRIVVPTVELSVYIRTEVPQECLPPQAIYGEFSSTHADSGVVDENGVMFLEDGRLLAQSRQLSMIF